jgi:hypothetical protein
MYFMPALRFPIYGAMNLRHRSNLVVRQPASPVWEWVRGAGLLAWKKLKIW